MWLLSLYLDVNSKWTMMEVIPGPQGIGQMTAYRP